MPASPKRSGTRASHRLLAVLSCLLLVLASTVGVQGSVLAHADDSTPSSWNIPDYAITAVVDRNGDARVTLDMSFDFSNDQGHGPYVTFATRQKLTDDPDHWRMIDYSDISASSPSGADATIKIQNEGGAMLIRLGSTGHEYTGVQKYHISFTVHGLIARDNAASGLDEFNWQVFDGFDVPMGRATVRISGPANVSRASCFNDGSTQDCTSTSSGDTASFSAGAVAAHDPLQVVAGFPAGTFTGAADARQTKRYNPGNTFGLDVGSSIGTVFTILVAGWFAARSRRRGGDREFIGVPPGVIPPEGEGRVGRRRSAPEVAVAFQPPRDVSPAEAGTLIDGSADTEDVTAAILDLAVRGHITITPERTDRRGRSKDWSFQLRPECPDTMRAWEEDLIDDFFSGGATTSTAIMRTEHDNTTLSVAKSALDRVMVAHGWYDRSPSIGRAIAFMKGLGVLVLGVLLAVAGAFFGLGLIGVPVAIAGVVLAIMGLIRSPARTATGTAILDQVKGFRLYLETAEADQIRFEEGIDVFSRYLPWATVFGVADRWVKVFQELAASGRYTGGYYGWYGGDVNSLNLGFAAGFASSMNDLTSAMSSSLQSAATSSTSSSGSGFSGGGGFGGGGGGGW